jgi:hypothetical protein
MFDWLPHLSSIKWHGCAKHGYTITTAYMTVDAYNIIAWWRSRVGQHGGPPAVRYAAHTNLALEFHFSQGYNYSMSPPYLKFKSNFHRFHEELFLSSATKQTPRLPRNPTVPCRIHKSSLMVRIIILYNTSSLTSISMSSFHLWLGLNRNINELLKNLAHISIIPTKTEVKYLGLHLDQKLTWKTHIRMKREQLRLKVRQMNWLIGNRS